MTDGFEVITTRRDNDLSAPASIDSEPWNKLHSESAKAYSAFLSYRNLEPKERSLKKAVIALYGNFSSSKLRQFQHWSALNMWVDRSTAWDVHVAHVADKQHVEDVKKMQADHVMLAKGLISKAAQRLQNMEPIELSTNDVLRFIAEGVRIQRVTLGEPDAIQETIEGDRTEVTFAEMTDQELIQKIIALRISRNTGRDAK